MPIRTLVQWWATCLSIQLRSLYAYGWRPASWSKENPIFHAIESGPSPAKTQWEVAFIFPSWIALLQLGALVYTCVQPTDGPLAAIVTFSRMKGAADRISCDWCSVANSVFHTLQKNPSRWKRWTWCQLAVLTTVNWSLWMAIWFRVDRGIWERFRKEAVRSHTVDNYAARQMADMVASLDYIELRWCPFRSEGTREYWRNADPRFAPVSAAPLVARQLAESVHPFQGIECMDCVQVANQWVGTEHAAPSMFQPFVRLLDKLVH